MCTGALLLLLKAMASLLAGVPLNRTRPQRTMILQPFLSYWRRCCDAPARGLGIQQVLLWMLLLISKSLRVPELLLEP